MTPRLPSSERRAQILSVAHRVLSEQGFDKLQLTLVADAAGVSRQFLYRFFEGRTALLVALMEDFAARMGAGFAAVAPAALESGDLAVAARLFVGVVCDVIEDRGAGAWFLLAARDPEIGPHAAALIAGLVDPWLPQIELVVGGTESDARAAAEMVLAVGRAGLDQWLLGRVPRDSAIDYAAGAIGGVLGAVRSPEKA